MIGQLDIFGNAVPQTVVNVASVPQRSPFRYPGGKTWLVPVVRRWLRHWQPLLLIEPFAGGGIVSLTAAFEELAEQVLMVELDEEVAAVWEVILSEKNQWLADKILTFNLTHENALLELSTQSKFLEDIAFCTILKNRIFHGGILAKGSGMIKQGENGKGLTSRWYPKTLYDRITAIQHVQNRLQFCAGDAFDFLSRYEKDTNICFFIDPPYTIAGKRLYTCYDLDHERLFAQVSRLAGHYMLTYDDTPEIRILAKKYGLSYQTIPMKTTHHIEKNEIIISDNFEWYL